MWPWCVGLRGQGCQKSLWRVLEGLKPGKRQAWTLVKSYWCRLEGQENKRHAWVPCDERAKFHTSGGPRRRPARQRRPGSADIPSKNSIYPRLLVPIGDSDHAFLRLGIADYLQNSERAPPAGFSGCWWNGRWRWIEFNIYIYIYTQVYFCTYIYIFISI